MNIKEELESRRIEVEEILKKYLPEPGSGNKALADAMRYSILVGGKRLRPIMMLESYRVFGGSETTIDPFLAAIEMIHTHSLVHDDLPALDNDEYRRGKKTTHAVYGEAIGVLAGAGLLNLAYETVLQAYYHKDEWDRALRAMRILAGKTGLSGMLGGQGLDVENEKNGTPVQDEKELLYIYENKTAALIEAPLMIGAVLAGAENEEVKVMEKVGHKTGLAFQVRDDILDVISTQEEMGKPAFSDAKNEKTTFVTLHSVEEAEKQVEAWSEEAMTLLRKLPQDTGFLETLILELAGRRK